jgi:hypothetical protein
VSEWKPWFLTVWKLRESSFTSDEQRSNFSVPRRRVVEFRVTRRPQQFFGDSQVEPTWICLEPSAEAMFPPMTVAPDEHDRSASASQQDADGHQPDIDVQATVRFFDRTELTAHLFAN